VTPTEKYEVHVQAASAVCMGGLDELSAAGVPWRHLVDGMALCMAATTAGAQMFLTPPERSLLTSRLARRLREVVDEELRRPGDANLIIPKKEKPLADA